MRKKSLLGIVVFLMLVLPSVLAVQAVDNLRTDNDEPAVEIIRPERGYIYIFDHKTVPYGFPFVRKPSSNNAYAFGRPSLTIEVNVTQGYNVEYVSFKIFERTLFNGRVELKEYKDYDEPYQFKFTRYTIFPFWNYDVYVDAIDTIGNVIGSDKIGLGYYRAIPMYMTSFIQFSFITSMKLFLLYRFLSFVS